MVVTEEHFQQLLDENPAYSTVRMIFADWLDEQGDLRAGGYRELGRLGKYPKMGYTTPAFYEYAGVIWEWWHGGCTILDVFSIKDRWFDRIHSNYVYASSLGVILSKDFPTRREADNAAAIAYHHYRAGVAASTGSEPR